MVNTQMFSYLYISPRSQAAVDATAQPVGLKMALKLVTRATRDEEHGLEADP